MKKIILLLFSCVFLSGYELKAQLSIATDSILQLSTCAGGNIVVPYTVSGGSYNFGNVFTAQLSNAFGQFTAPVNIGSVFFWSSGVILCTIPANTNFGLFYKIRVIASNPQDTGSPCPNTLIITQIAQLNQIVPYPGDTMCANDTITLTAINFANSYSWSTGDTTAQIHVTQPGIYTVTTTDVLGCESTTSDTVIASACTGVMENELDKALSVYPNPASGKIFLQWSASGTHGLNLQLYDAQGKEILLKNDCRLNSVSDYSLDISGLSPGMYMLVIDDGGSRVARRIMVQ